MVRHPCGMTASRITFRLRSQPNMQDKTQRQRRAGTATLVCTLGQGGRLARSVPGLLAMLGNRSCMARTGFSLEGRKELEDIISAEENFQYATITSGQASCNILSSCQAEAPSLRCDSCDIRSTCCQSA